MIIATLLSLAGLGFALALLGWYGWKSINERFAHAE